MIAAKTAELTEANPMLGHRGCRLGITFPEIYEIQVQAIGEAALNATRVWGLDDFGLVNAAAGAGVQACHNAALLLLAGRAEDDHPFALKYRLFERGRWPVALIGSSLHLF